MSSNDFQFSAARALFRRGLCTGRYPTVELAEAALEGLAKARLGHWEVDTHDGGRGRPVRRLILAIGADTNSPNPEQNSNCVSVDTVSASENNGDGAAEDINSQLAETWSDEESNP